MCTFSRSTIKQEFNEPQEDNRLKPETAEEVEEASEMEAPEEDRQREVVEESKVGPTKVQLGDGLLKPRTKNPLIAKTHTSPGRSIQLSGSLLPTLTAPVHTEPQTPRTTQKRVT